VAEPIPECSISPHAIVEMTRRGIAEAIVRRVLAAPEQREAVRRGRDVLHSRVEFERKTYLVRVVVDVDRSPPEVVTAYRTSKIEKYWRNEP
jgi:hypothetical protein